MIPDWGHPKKNITQPIGKVKTATMTSGTQPAWDTRFDAEFVSNRIASSESEAEFVTASPARENRRHIVEQLQRRGLVALNRPSVR